MSLDYPQSDISWIKEREKGQGYDMETTFFGLYGVSSPLPGFYTEELFDEDWEEQQPSRQFFDIIHYRLYPLLYQAWLKYRFNFNAIEKNNKEYWELIYSLIGLGKEFREQFPGHGMLIKYTGILSQHPKSQSGLQTILANVVEDVAVIIEPCVTRHVKINKQQQCLLGECNNKIGEDSVVGEYVIDRSGKFKIKLGPVNQHQFSQISNNKSLIETIHKITRLFLVQPLLYDIELILEEGAETSVILGERERSTLGKNTWIGSSEQHQQYSLTLN